jgi:hypothetical protein
MPAKIHGGKSRRRKGYAKSRGGGNILDELKKNVQMGGKRRSGKRRSGMNYSKKRR